MSVRVINTVIDPVPVAVESAVPLVVDCDGSDVLVANTVLDPVPVVVVGSGGSTASETAAAAQFNKGAYLTHHESGPASTVRIGGQSFAAFVLTRTGGTLQRIAVGSAVLFDLKPTGTGVGALLAATAPGSTKRRVRIWATTPSAGFTAYSTNTVFTLMFTEGSLPPTSSFGFESITASPWNACATTATADSWAMSSFVFSLTPPSANSVLGCAEYVVDHAPGNIYVTLMVNQQEADLTAGLQSPQLQFWVEITPY